MITRFAAVCWAGLISLPLCFPLAAAPRILPEGQRPADHRLEPLKDLDGYFPFTPPASKAEWEKRAERVQRQVLVSQGLWPMPTKTPLNGLSIPEAARKLLGEDDLESQLEAMRRMLRALHCSCSQTTLK